MPQAFHLTADSRDQQGATSSKPSNVCSFSQPVSSVRLRSRLPGGTVFLRPDHPYLSNGGQTCSTGFETQRLGSRRSLTIYQHQHASGMSRIISGGQAEGPSKRTFTSGRW